MDKQELIEKAQSMKCYAELTVIKGVTIVADNILIDNATIYIGKNTQTLK